MQRTTHEEATGSGNVCVWPWPKFNTVTVSYFRCHSAHVGEWIVMNLGPEDRLAKLHADSIKSDSGRTVLLLSKKSTSSVRLRKNCEKKLLASSCLPVRMELLGSHSTHFSLNLTFLLKLTFFIKFNIFH